jgi:hypothetical protein
LLAVAVGVVIGWNYTQPEWAKSAQQKVLKLFGLR